MPSTKLKNKKKKKKTAQFITENNETQAQLQERTVAEAQVRLMS